MTMSRAVLYVFKYKQCKLRGEKKRLRNNEEERGRLQEKRNKREIFIPLNFCFLIFTLPLPSPLYLHL